MKETNKMREIRVEKVTLNIGTGKEQPMLEKGLILLKNITGAKPVKCYAKKRIPSWGVRPGLPVGCKVTVRKNTHDLIVRTLSAVDNTLDESNFDDFGNVSFGIEEYIDITGVKYDPKIGMLGLQVCITLGRAGYRIARRKIGQRKIHRRHSIKKEEAIEFMKKMFNLMLREEEK